MRIVDFFLFYQEVVIGIVVLSFIRRQDSMNKDIFLACPIQRFFQWNGKECPATVSIYFYITIILVQNFTCQLYNTYLKFSATGFQAVGDYLNFQYL